MPTSLSLSLSGWRREEREERGGRGKWEREREREVGEGGGRGRGKWALRRVAPRLVGGDLLRGGHVVVGVGRRLVLVLVRVVERVGERACRAPCLEELGERRQRVEVAGP